MSKEHEFISHAFCHQYRELQLQQGKGPTLQYWFLFLSKCFQKKKCKYWTYNNFRPFQSNNLTVNDFWCFNMLWYWFVLNVQIGFKLDVIMFCMFVCSFQILIFNKLSSQKDAPKQYRNQTFGCWIKGASGLLSDRGLKVVPHPREIEGSNPYNAAAWENIINPMAYLRDLNFYLKKPKQLLLCVQLIMSIPQHWILNSDWLVRAVCVGFF